MSNVGFSGISKIRNINDYEDLWQCFPREENNPWKVIPKYEPYVYPYWPQVYPKPRPDIKEYFTPPPKPPFKASDISVELLVNGRTLSRIGNTFEVEKHGVSYEIKISNSSAHKVCVVVSVDGLSVMNGEEANDNGIGYLVEPHDSIVIKGWRRGDSEVAQFTFTDEQSSYAGITKNSQDKYWGTIMVVAYPEKQRPKVTYRPASIMSFSSTMSWSEEKTATGYGDYIKDDVVFEDFNRDYSSKQILVYRYNKVTIQCKEEVLSRNVW